MWGQFRVLVATIISVGSIALLYAEVAKPLVSMGTGNGEFTGPFSTLVNQVDSVVPLVLAFLLLGVVIWVIVSTVQEERSVNRRPPR